MDGMVIYHMLHPTVAVGLPRSLDFFSQKSLIDLRLSRVASFRNFLWSSQSSWALVLWNLLSAFLLLLIAS